MRDKAPDKAKTHRRERADSLRKPWKFHPTHTPLDANRVAPLGLSSTRIVQVNGKGEVRFLQEVLGRRETRQLAPLLGVRPRW